VSIERATLDRLLAAAAAAAANSWSPYSRFPVGAALLCADGTVVTGANVENRSFGLTICAERSAAVTAVSQGRRDWVAVAVSCPSAAEPVSPCGACRQVLSEFCAPETPVVYAGKDPARRVLTTIGELLPADALQHLRDRR
jgi:cytidine deaminase